MLPCRDALPYLTEDSLGLPISFSSYSCIHALLTDSTGLCVCNLLGLWQGRNWWARLVLDVVGGGVCILTIVLAEVLV